MGKRGRRRVEQWPLWSPRGMPDLRVAVRAWADSAVPADVSGRDVATRLAGEMFWVTPDMTALAVQASRSLPEWTPAAVIPCQEGMLLWDGEHTALVSAMLAGGDDLRPQLHAAGAAWRVSGGQLSVVVLHRRDRVQAAMRTIGTLSGRHFELDPGPPVMPGSTVEPIDMTATGRTPDMSPGDATDFMALLVATWLLMEQPTIATARPLTPKGAAYRRAVARDQPIPRVRLVDLRTVRYSHDEEPEPGEGREYTRRWLVRGHWRQQACGPRRSQRRPTWIAPHVKGPDGAPLIIGDQVNVWRR